MSILDTVNRAKEHLREQGRLSLRLLKRELGLDDDILAELVEELVDVQRVAALEDRVLVWRGAAVPAMPGADAPQAGESGERRQITILFCDLVGSTPLSQQLDAEDWRDVIAQYQAAAAAAVTRFGGYVAKNLGDGLLVYFGWPVAREDDPERAVRAGLEIVEAVTRLAVGRSGGMTVTAKSLSVRVGMHTGTVVIADGGEVFGESANIAARAQSAADPDTVVITGATQRLVAGLFVVEERGAQRLKGIREPVALYRVVQPSGVRSRLEVAAGHLTRFVGREIELATLIDRCERAQDGEGQTIVVIGEAGVGKSRLVYQLHEHLSAVPHTWLECGATPYTEGTPFHPVIELVGQGLSFSPEDSDADKLGKLEAGLRLMATAENVAVLADFLGLPPPLPLRMSPELQRRKTIDLLTRLNLLLSLAQPLVVVVEDLHWCDASTLELLGQLIARSAEARILLLATARPEFTPPWPSRANVTVLPLARLSKRQARAMVATIGAGALPEEMVETLVARADGMPLYVEELTKAVVESGVANGSVEAIPPTLADSLMARLDRLSTAKEVAQQAAVLGREFSHALLAAVARMKEPALRAALSRLVNAEIVYARGEPPDTTYTFKHALVQEAAYASLLKRTRQRLHGRVVDVLRERFPARAAAEPEVMARHAEAAGRIDDAITYHRLAGEQAQGRWAHEEAIGQFRKALALLEDRPTGIERDDAELTLQLVLAASLIAMRGFAHPETGAACDRAVALARSTGDTARLDMARIGLGNFYLNRAELERSRVLYAEVLAGAEARGDRQQEAMGHANLAVVEHTQGKFASSLARCERALALYDPEHGRGLMRVQGADDGVVAQSYGAWNHWSLGHPDKALAGAQESVAMARRLENPFTVALALFFEIVVHWYRDRRGTAAASDRLAELVTLSEAQGFPLWLGLGRSFQAGLRVLNGDRGAAAEVIEAMAMAAETGNQSGVPGLMLFLAETQRTTGQLAEAQGTVAAGLAVAAQTGQFYFDADLNRLDGDLLVALGGGAAEAVGRYERALAIAREQAARSFELRAAMSLSRLWWQQGKRAAARDLLAPVYAWFTEGFETRDLIDAKALLAELK